MKESEMSDNRMDEPAEVEGLVERLQGIAYSGCNPYLACSEAFTALTALQAENERLRSAGDQLAKALRAADLFPDQWTGRDAALAAHAKLKGEV